MECKESNQAKNNNIFYGIACHDVQYRNWQVFLFYQLTVPEDLGELFKVRIGFQGDQELSWYEDFSGAPTWFIEEVM